VAVGKILSRFQPGRKPLTSAVSWRVVWGLRTATSRKLKDWSRTQKKPQEVEDYSGAAPAIIQEKIGKKKLKKIKKEEREKTKGSGWFNMPAPELTEESRRDLELLQMRGALDPKRFYKKSDAKNLPKYFQIGTVVDSPYDFYSDRIPTKARKRTMVDELLADAEFKKYNKRKYVEIIEAKNSKEPRMRRTKKK